MILPSDMRECFFVFAFFVTLLLTLTITFFVSDTLMAVIISCWYNRSALDVLKLTRKKTLTTVKGLSGSFFHFSEFIEIISTRVLLNLLVVTELTPLQTSNKKMVINLNTSLPSSKKTCN